MLTFVLGSKAVLGQKTEMNIQTRVDMSKALHFAYTSHGKTLTKTLLTYTLTWFKCNFFFYQEAKNITKS